MEDLAGMRFKIINQMVKTFIQQEKKFFETCYFLINNFYKGMGIMEQGLPYQKSSYDPMKYIRANKIMEGVDVNSLPNIKMKDKYSSNNFKNSSNMPINNYNENYNKKYSFEDYKLRKSNMQNNSNINNNQNNIKASSVPYNSRDINTNNRPQPPLYNPTIPNPNIRTYHPPLVRPIVMPMPIPTYPYPPPLMGEIYPIPPFPEELELMYQMGRPYYSLPFPRIYPDYYPYY
jgi:hypothetical protein